jgi:multiple sugar transport system permease protein
MPLSTSPNSLPFKPVLFDQRLRRLLSNTAVYAVLIFGAFVSLIPLLWTVSTAFKIPAQTFVDPPVWVPNPIVLDNFVKVFTRLPFARFFWNTTIITLANILGTLLSCSLVAFAFGRLRWFGRDLWFIVLISTMLIPSQVTMIPVFILFHKLHWVNTFKPLIVPAFLAGGAAGAFNIFLMRQFILGIPPELDEAAKLDGCGYFRIFALIIMPLIKPVLGAVAIFTFMDHWNEFMTPLIYLNNEESFTLAIGLRYFIREYSQIDWNQLMAASLLTLLPCVLIFFFTQKYFIKGINLGGEKE